jgi:hypothetical protein
VGWETRLGRSVTCARTGLAQLCRSVVYITCVAGLSRHASFFVPVSYRPLNCSIMSATETLTETVDSKLLPLQTHLDERNVGQNEDVIQADVAYLKYEPKHELEKLYMMNYDTEGAFPRTNAKNELKPISVQNIRHMNAPPSYEACGFTTWKLRSALSMADFDRTSRVEDVFYTEVKNLLKDKYPDACAIEVLEHQVPLVFATVLTVLVSRNSLTGDRSGSERRSSRTILASRTRTFCQRLSSTSTLHRNLQL